MKIELAHYNVFPKVLLAGHTHKITIAPRGTHAMFSADNDYTFEIIPLEQSRESMLSYSYQEAFSITDDGALTFSYFFAQEQGYLIRITSPTSRFAQLDFRVYALAQDLYEKRPLKGDLHTHSCRSDGREEPIVVAANYRKYGYDFMAITDHWKWQPSKECIEKYEQADIPTDLTLFYGEEVHSQGGYIHAINFGGSSSVNEYYEQNTAQCIAQAEALAKEAPFTDEYDALDYGRRVWIANQIKATGGLAILVHPHWMNHAYNMRDEITDALFANNIYEAFELIGGQSVTENCLQIAMYHEQIAKGRTINVVGSSDSHGTEPALYFKEAFTIAFVSGDRPADILDAIRAGDSVAVEEYEGQPPRCHGNMRLVKFAMFLLDEFYPKHNELCFEQGRLMKAHMLHEEDASALLHLLQGRSEAYYKAFYGKAVY